MLLFQVPLGWWVARRLINTLEFSTSPPLLLRLIGTFGVICHGSFVVLAPPLALPSLHLQITQSSRIDGMSTCLEQQWWLCFQLTFLTTWKLAGSLETVLGLLGVSPCVLFAKYLWILLPELGFAKLKWIWITQKIFSLLRNPVVTSETGTVGHEKCLAVHSQVMRTEKLEFQLNGVFQKNVWFPAKHIKSSSKGNV